MNWLSKLLCRLGMHGPIWLGAESQVRSERTGPLERTCGHCQKKWHGYMTENRYVRYAVWSPVRADGTSVAPR